LLIFIRWFLLHVLSPLNKKQRKGKITDKKLIIMTLNKKQHSGHTYFELHISCPVCYDRGMNTPQSNWTHHGCGGSIFLGDDAYYWCDSCDHKSHVRMWKYGCPNHSSGADYEFITASSIAVAQAISTAGQMVSETGVAWLQSFLSNMGEF
jgi:hypothetical protein